jgi:hypothetical protein
MGFIDMICVVVRFLCSIGYFNPFRFVPHLFSGVVGLGGCASGSFQRLHCLFCYSGLWVPSSPLDLLKSAGTKLLFQLLRCFEMADGYGFLFQVY